MVLNAAVQMLREADELKQKILKFKSGTSMLQERNLWVTQQQLQKVYQKVLVLDLDYALDKKVEQDLWNVGFKQQIEALQAISKDRKNPLRSEGQAMLSWVLQAAAGFYLCLLHQICTTFQLDLPFRRRASLLGWVEGWGAGAAGGARVPPPAAARYICQHCLVHLGDLARYRQQLRVAHTFYRHALAVSAHSGQPYNQLALVSWRRGRRLGALYWHVRSLLVRAPFPPAPANLARTLHAAASGGLSRDSNLPVLPGVVGVVDVAGVANEAERTTTRLDAHAYVNELIRAMHMIHTVEQLDTAAAIVKSLNSSLTALIATDSFESMTLIKMSCVLIWLVQSSNEDFKVDCRSLTAAEALAAALAQSLAAGALQALLLPAYTHRHPPARAQPALKVLLGWAVSRGEFVRGAAWGSRAALCPALAHALNGLAALVPHPVPRADLDTYETAPLPEDEELHGFLPLEETLKPLRLGHASWATYGGRVPDVPDATPGDDEVPREVAPPCLSSDPELERRVRAYRLLQLGVKLAELLPDQLQVTESEDGLVQLTALSVGGEQLSAALAQLEGASASASAGAGADAGSDGEGADDSEDEPSPPPPPIVISEADFREKVREKRVGILKPQGSLERAREERALASTQEDPEPEEYEEPSKGEDKKEIRKPRVNIAMAAIMRKQEESNKQVKFVTPPPTPETSKDAAEAKDQDKDKPKMIQPKPIKGLNSLPLGRKTGGILSLKDKSAGYPHLVNTDPEPAKKTDKEEKKESKPQGSSQNSQQNYTPKRQELPPSPKWGPVQQHETPRGAFQKNYAQPAPGLAPGAFPAPGIRLPVVNPKEIDVRTAALQKQTSRGDLFQEGHKFGNYNYQMSGDKKNFLSDLPPRFANQHRYWHAPDASPVTHATQATHVTHPAHPTHATHVTHAPPPPHQLAARGDDIFNPPQPSWNQDPYSQPMAWWKPESAGGRFAGSAPGFFSQPPPYTPPRPKPDNLFNAGYLQSSMGQPQLQNLQNMVNSPNFNSSLNNFGTYGSVGYDAAMYPQFGAKPGLPPPPGPVSDPRDVGGFGSNPLDRNVGIQFNDPMNRDSGAVNKLDQTGGAAGSTYSLFSAESAAWGAGHQRPHQSLWSGPGSPLERLLEQQKQMKPQ